MKIRYRLIQRGGDKGGIQIPVHKLCWTRNRNEWGKAAWWSSGAVLMGDKRKATCCICRKEIRA